MINTIQKESSPLLSVVMPCLNEEAAIGACIQKIQATLSQAKIHGEIIVCDNGSTDRSVAIAKSMGVQVVHQPERGYGNAYLKGFSSARGTYLVMGDADDTYDFTLIPTFLEKLDEGYDFVTGSRYLQGGPTSIPFLHRFLGNPLLTAILNILFKTTYTDVYCGFRAFSRKAYDQIKPVSPGMEFNLELAINAGLAHLKSTEIPIRLHERKGESKLRTFRDGWRSLRMMLIYCPNKVFLIPGLFAISLGLGAHFLSLAGLVRFHGEPLGTVTGIFGTIFSVTGFQILNLWLHAKTYSWSRRFDADNPGLAGFYEWFKLETGLFCGFLLLLVGGAILSVLVFEWIQSSFGPLRTPEWVSFGATLVIMGAGTIFSSLFISAMSMKKA
ncbi:MAG: glycosyltransferase family 2 protein [Nitrospirota bacterium]|nr:glycosyltransferase family 2 protein [Nitrospirota bacterium]MDH4359586.1 glycosyltransferase family 2 protein [Nitrospirota bacterium]